MNNARLVATAGYQKGTAWPLKNGPLLMGRDASNQVEVGDPAVSRKHCSISQLASGGFEIVDLDSHNGTSVNGTKVSRRPIEHGDRIRIGSSEYVFLTGPDDGAITPSRPGNTPGDTALMTVHLDISGVPSSATGMGRMARDLSAFFKIANVINSTRDVQALQRELLVLISEVIPAAEAAIVLQPGRNDPPRPLCTWNRKGLAEAEMIIREEPVQQATWERCAVFSAASGDAATEHVLCAPLVGVERILGVIYLSSPAASAAFTEEHAYFLSSISRIAAVTLENLSQLDSLRAENQRLRVEVKGDHSLIGESRPMQRVNEFITRVAKGNSTVLIRGESGTGKELVARAIHANGLRPDRPFIAINCAAIPEALLESELFGHEKGAFTGAAGVRKGKFEAAEDGTLFLDEIGEMAPLLQGKLLRVLQQREFERLGGNRLLPFNARDRKSVV